MQLGKVFRSCEECLCIVVKDEALIQTLVPDQLRQERAARKAKSSAVVIPVMTQHYTMLQRNLLYTGGTRDKKLVVLVGQKKAVAIAVRDRPRSHF